MILKIVGTGAIIHAFTGTGGGIHGTIAFPIDFEVDDSEGKRVPVEKIEAALKEKLEGMTFEV